MKKPHTGRKCRDPTQQTWLQQSHKIPCAKNLAQKATTQGGEPMKRFLPVLTAVFLLGHLACIEGSISVPTPVDQPKKRETKTQMSFRTFRHIPPLRTLRWGIQLEAPETAIIKSNRTGHLITDGAVHIFIEKISTSQLQAAGISADPMNKTFPKQQLEGTKSFTSWIPVPGAIFRFTCAGKIDKPNCQRILDSLQIIRR